MKKKIIVNSLLAVLLLLLADIFLTWFLTALETFPHGIRPAYTVEESRSRGAFVANVNVSPRTIHLKEGRVVIHEAWIEKSMELVRIYVFIPFVLEHREYRLIGSHNLCVNLAEGNDLMLGNYFFVREGKGAGFVQLGTVIFWENIENVDFERLTVLVTDNWKLENAQRLELRLGQR
jgi:hypothetical protein